MKRFSFFAIGMFLLLLIINCTTPAKNNSLLALKNKFPGEGVVLMELFTSQGCSSCPAAEALLSKYVQQKNPHIIPIAFHVDYWNRLGWKDSFSDSKYSQRQNEYAQILNPESVYTPQLILNGKKELVGSDAEKVNAGVTAFLKETPTASVEITGINTGNGIVTGTYLLSGSYEGKKIRAALLQQQATTIIKAGENQGRSLTELNVVRDFVSAESTSKEGSIMLSLPKGAAFKDFSLVIFLQDDKTYGIAAAAQKKVQ